MLGASAVGPIEPRPALREEVFVSEPIRVPAVGAQAAAEPARSIPLEFRASGGEYFRIWIVNLLLSVATLGVYSAWAKVRRLRYFYGNTSLDGVVFDYHGRPLAILKGRLIAFGAYGVFYAATQVFPLAAIGFFPLFALGVPWIIMKSRRFQLRMTSHRGIRFGFDGDYAGALKAYVGWPLLAAFTLYLMGGRMLWEQVRYLLGNARYGSEPVRFTAPRGPFHRMFLVSTALFALIIVGAFAAFTALVAAQEGEELSERILAAMTSPAALGCGAALFLAWFAALAYYQKELLNASFDGLELGPHRLESHLAFAPLFGIYVSNFLAIVLTLGLYSPWAKVRQTKYQLESLRVAARGDLDGFAAGAGDGTDAIGEEIGDFFDLDFGL